MSTMTSRAERTSVVTRSLSLNMRLTKILLEIVCAANVHFGFFACFPWLLKLIALWFVIGTTLASRLSPLLLVPGSK